MTLKCVCTCMYSYCAIVQNEVTQLKAEMVELKTLLLAHKDCPITRQQQQSGQLYIHTGQSVRDRCPSRLLLLKYLLYKVHEVFLFCISFCTAWKMLKNNLCTSSSSTHRRCSRDRHSHVTSVDDCSVISHRRQRSTDDARHVVIVVVVAMGNVNRHYRRRQQQSHPHTS